MEEVKFARADSDNAAPEDSVRKLKWLVHLVVPLLLSLAGLGLALLLVYSFNVNDYDYSVFSNMLWQFANGNGWHTSIYAGEVREFFLADHLAWLVPLLSPFFILFPSPYTLVVVHSLSFAATFFLVPLFVKEVWKQRGREDYVLPALFLLLLLAVSRGFCGAWAYPTHMTTLVMPFLLACLIALHRKALVWAVVFFLLAALGQERVSVALFGVGMYAAFITQNRRLGLALCAFSTLYFFAAVKLLIPFFSGGDYLYTDTLRLFHGVDRKALYLLLLFASWLFLPLVGKRAWLVTCCAAPIVSLNLLSDRKVMYAFSLHYQDLPSVFFLAAASFGLLHLLETGWLRKLPRKGLLLLACAGLFVSCADSYASDNKKMPLRFLAKWRPNASLSQLNAALSTYAGLPPEIRVYASSGIGPRFNMRKHRYVLTLQAAGQAFNSSMVFVAPGQNMYPHEAQKEEVVALLLSNPSLVLTQQTSELMVFSSADLCQEGKLCPAMR